MRTARLRHPLLREVVIPFLCAIMALWGIAQARAQGSKIADPAHAVAFMLCTPQSTTGEGDAPPNHDCGDCCLPNPVAASGYRAPFPLRYQRIVAVEPETRLLRTQRLAMLLPWSRGPPAFL
jgi:hypothetical protein